MKIAIGNDHAAGGLKTVIIDLIQKLGHEVVDVGAPIGEAVDYPIPGEKVGRLVASGEADLGVLICGTGVGISLAACLKITDITLCCNGFATCGFDLIHHSLGPFFGTIIIHNDKNVLTCQLLCDRRADTSGGSGYKRYLFIQHIFSDPPPYQYLSI